MVSYAMSGGSERNSVANVTVDTPSIIFSLDPIFALLDFASTPFKGGLQEKAEPDDNHQLLQPQAEQPSEDKEGGLAFRVNVVQASVKLLADPTRQDSEAIVLSIRQVQLAQQGTLILSVDHMGIFLCKMDRQKETIRILDDFDLNLSMDNRKEDGNQSSSIKLDMQAVVLRLSNRDVLLVSSIVSRAVELSNSSTVSSKQQESSQIQKKARRPSDAKQSGEALLKARRRSSAATSRKQVEDSRKKVDDVIKKESVANTVLNIIKTRLTSFLATGNFRGLPSCADFRPTRIASFGHESASIHGTRRRLVQRCKKYFPRREVSLAEDLVQMRASVSISPVIDYYNLANSRWEALMDSWEFNIQVCL